MNNFCFYWVNTSVKWSQSDWTWSECETVLDVCKGWGTTEVWWKNANWKWSDCSGSNVLDVCKVWGTDGQRWKDSNMWWSLCFGSGSNPPIPPIPVVTSSLQPFGVDATTVVQPWLVEPWNPYTANDEHDKKRKRLIKLICKVKGQTYEEEKEMGTMNISVDDVRMVVKKVLNIDLDVKLEE